MIDQPKSSTPSAAIRSIEAFVFDGEGAARAVSPADTTPKDGDNQFAFAWVHLKRDDEAARATLDSFALEPIAMNALVAADTRPRCTVFDSGVLLNLRGVNYNEGREPENMISVRLWIEPSRIVGVWLYPLRAVGDLFDSFDAPNAPKTPGELISRLAENIVLRMEPFMEETNECMDTLEAVIVDDAARSDAGKLAKLRRTIITLQRFVLPEREALQHLSASDLHWLGDDDRDRLSEAINKLARISEDLGLMRARAEVLNDQILAARSWTMNRHMLFLAVVAAIFMPLDFLSGLMGVNVGGLPGQDFGWAFFILVGGMAVIAAIELWLLRKLGFLR